MPGDCLAALRAWVLAEPPVAEMMINARQAMGTGTNTLRLRLVAAFVAAGPDSRALFPLAPAQGVAFIPRRDVLTGGASLRLAFSAEPRDRTRAGIQRLRCAIDR